MGISHKYKFIFIHIPKCAGSSINKYFDSRNGGHHKWFWYKKKYFKAWNKYWKFSVIRDPFDRLVSKYEYAKMDCSYWHASDGNARFGVHKDYEKLKDKSFVECIDMLLNDELEYVGWQPQYLFVCDKKGKVAVDNLYKIEEVNDVFAQKGYKIPYINKSDRKYNHFVPEEYRNRIYEYYKKDFELWELISL